MPPILKISIILSNFQLTTAIHSTQLELPANLTQDTEKTFIVDWLQ